MKYPNIEVVNSKFESYSVGSFIKYSSQRKYVTKIAKIEIIVVNIL